MLWAVTCNGVLSRLASLLASREWSGLLTAALVLFVFKLLAYVAAFQYLDAVSVTWQVYLQYTDKASDVVF